MSEEGEIEIWWWVVRRVWSVASSYDIWFVRRSLNGAGRYFCKGTIWMEKEILWGEVEEMEEESFWVAVESGIFWVYEV